MSKRIHPAGIIPYVYAPPRMTSRRRNSKVNSGALSSMDLWIWRLTPCSKGGLAIGVARFDETSCPKTRKRRPQLRGHLKLSGRRFGFYTRLFILNRTSSVNQTGTRVHVLVFWLVRNYRALEGAAIVQDDRHGHAAKSIRILFGRAFDRRENRHAERKLVTAAKTAFREL